MRCRDRPLALHDGLWSSEGTSTVHSQVCWRCFRGSPSLLARESAQPHASQCVGVFSLLLQEEGGGGAAHHPIPKFCAPACFLCHTMRLTERSFQNISIRGDLHPSAHWIGFLSQGPPVDLRHGVVMSWMWCIRRGDKGARRGV